MVFKLWNVLEPPPYSPVVLNTSMCTGSVSSVQARQWVADSTTMLFNQWNGSETLPL